MDSVVPVQNKNFSWDGKELAKNSRAVWKAKSHLHWQFVGICHILWRSIMESSYFHTSSIWDEWDCWKSSAQNEWRDVCSIVAIRLGWKLVGCFFGMLLLSAKHSRSLVGWENALWETTWKILWRTDHSVRSNGWIFSDFCERAVKAPPIWWESLTRIMPRICIGCGRGQEIFWLQTLRSWENWTRQKIHARRLAAQEVLTKKRGEKFIFPIADGTSKLFGRIMKFENQLWGSMNLQGVKIPAKNFKETRMSLNQQKQKMTPKLAVTFGQWKEISIIVVTSNLEFNSTCGRKKHSQSHWNTLTWPELRTHIWTCCKKAVLTTIGMSMWIEICQIHGQDSRSLLKWTENLLKEKCGPEGDVQRSKQLPDLIICGLSCGLACQKQPRRRRSKNGPWNNRAWQCSKTERHLFYRSQRWRVWRDH